MRLDHAAARVDEEQKILGDLISAAGSTSYVAAKPYSLAPSKTGKMNSIGLNPASPKRTSSREDLDELPSFPQQVDGSHSATSSIELEMVEEKDNPLVASMISEQSGTSTMFFLGDMKVDDTNKAPPKKSYAGKRSSKLELARTSRASSGDRQERTFVPPLALEGTVAQAPMWTTPRKDASPSSTSKPSEAIVVVDIPRIVASPNQ
ncbi:unnamed protein product, partial [Amoebophrya sp. A25]|eukprot:GSA25T00009925001.1